MSIANCKLFLLLCIPFTCFSFSCSANNKKSIHNDIDQFYVIVKIIVFLFFTCWLDTTDYNNSSLNRLVPLN